MALRVAGEPGGGCAAPGTQGGLRSPRQAWWGPEPATGDLLLQEEQESGTSNGPPAQPAKAQYPIPAKLPQDVQVKGTDTPGDSRTLHSLVGTRSLLGPRQAGGGNRLHHLPPPSPPVRREGPTAPRGGREGGRECPARPPATQ